MNSSRKSSPIVELRQYTLRSGCRDTLIDLFERTFVESQEALGIELIGLFRDLDDPNRFVWLRGFADMPARAGALAAFYGGPVWREHAEAANATMFDSDNVLLLRPAADGAGFDDLAERGVPAIPGLVTASIHYLTPASLAAFVRFFDDVLAPAARAAGAEICARLQTEPAENTFPKLPVREGETVFVWFARFADGAAYVDYLEAFERGADWRAAASPEMFWALARRPEVLRLVPAWRSRLR